MIAVFGNPGGGKTTSQIPRIVEEARKGSTIIIDPQASLSRMSAAALSWCRERLFYIQLSQRTQPIQPLQVRYFGDEFFDRDERMRASRIFLGRRALDPTTSPLIFEFLEAGLQVIQQSHAPIYMLPFCFYPESPEYEWLMSNCDNYKIASLEFMRGAQLRNETSPTLRVVEHVCLDPRFQALCGTDDIGDLIHSGYHLILEGAGANKETTRTVCLLLMTLVMVFAESEHCRVLLVVDEVENYELLTPDVLFWLNTLRKQGVEIIVITQSMGFDEQALHKLLQACQRREYFRCGPEIAHRAAKDLVTSTYDPMAKWYEHNETPHYMSGGQQEALIAQELMSLPVGARYVNDHGDVLKEQVTLPSAFCLPGLAEKKAAKVIKQCRKTNDDNSWNDFWRSM